jgi:hypothetical protein
MTNPLTDVEIAAAEVQQAESTLLAARRKRDTAIRNAAPPKKVSEMTPAELRADARARGITGPV